MADKYQAKVILRNVLNFILCCVAGVFLVLFLLYSWDRNPPKVPTKESIVDFEFFKAQLDEFEKKFEGLINDNLEKKNKALEDASISKISSSIKELEGKIVADEEKFEKLSGDVTQLRNLVEEKIETSKNSILKSIPKNLKKKISLVTEKVQILETIKSQISELRKSFEENEKTDKSMDIKLSSLEEKIKEIGEKTCYKPPKELTNKDEEKIVEVDGQEL